MTTDSLVLSLAVEVFVFLTVNVEEHLHCAIILYLNIAVKQQVLFCDFQPIP